MFVVASLLSAIAGTTMMVAQSTPVSTGPMPAAVAPVSADTLNSGACLDSPKAVPQVLQAPAVRSMQVVRIDKVVSTTSMLPNEVIGYLYTLADGSTWLGQRTQDYVSAADASAINLVLASTHMPADPVTAFPAQTRMGLATRAQQFFKVSIPPVALPGLRIEIDPCVAWPAGRPLPDPKL